MSWPAEIHRCLKAHGVRQVAYVPDGGHAELLTLAQADPDMIPVSLTTEEEGIAVLAGAWLGGQRGVLLMQSSGVGNCVNLLSLAKLCQFPLLTLVTMRGEWAEFNPWQVPMGRGTPAAFELMGVQVRRVDDSAVAADEVQAAIDDAYGADQAIAVLFSQRLLGRKKWER